MRFRFLVLLLVSLAFFKHIAAAQVVILPPLQETIIAADGNPEGELAMDVGIVVVDAITGKLYSKRTTRASNTGWAELTAGSGSLGLTYSFSSQFTTTAITNIAIASGASITNANLITPTLGVATATTLDTGQGANELYDMNQNVLTTSAPAFVTLDTGQGANELYDMDQNVLTTSSPTYEGLTLSGTGALQLPSGTTAQQPANAAGLIRWNSTTGRIEMNIGTGWKNFVRLDGDWMTGPLVGGLTGITTTPTSFLTSSNMDLATVGSQVKDSPSITWHANAWLTGSVSNAPVAFRSYVVPSAGASTPAGLLTFDSSMNNGAFGNAVTISSAGQVTASGNIISGAAGYFSQNGRSAIAASAAGALEARNSSFSITATMQANVPQITKTANYVILVLDSGLQFDNIGAVVTNRLDLPTAVAKMRYMGYVDAAQRMQFQATGSDVIRDGGTVSGAAGGIYSATVGSTIELFAPKAGLWVVRSKNGTWTIE